VISAFQARIDHPLSDFDLLIRGQNYGITVTVLDCNSVIRSCDHTWSAASVRGAMAFTRVQSIDPSSGSIG